MFPIIVGVVVFGSSLLLLLTASLFAAVSRPIIPLSENDDSRGKKHVKKNNASVLMKERNSILGFIRGIRGILRLSWRFRRVLFNGRSYFENSGNSMEFSRLLVESGPFYVKLGQWLAQRPDVLPQSFVCALRTLQHDAPVHDINHTLCVMDNVHPDLQKAFDMFDVNPVSSASIAQVYRARVKRSALLEIARRINDDSSPPLSRERVGDDAAAAAEAAAADNSELRCFSVAQLDDDDCGSSSSSEANDNNAHNNTACNNSCLVAVKVRHPNVTESLRNDMLEFSAAVSVGSMLGNILCRVIDVEAVAADMFDQCDLKREARALDAIRKTMRHNKMVRYPVPIFATDEIIIETWMKGIFYTKIGVPAVDKTPYRSAREITLTKDLCKRITMATYMQMLVGTGMIHGDFHHGNLLFDIEYIGGGGGGGDDEQRQQQQKAAPPDSTDSDLVLPTMAPWHQRAKDNQEDNEHQCVVSVTTDSPLRHVDDENCKKCNSGGDKVVNSSVVVGNSEQANSKSKEQQQQQQKQQQQEDDIFRSKSVLPHFPVRVTLNLVDFGIVLRLPQKMRLMTTSLIEAMFGNDLDEVVNIFCNLITLERSKQLRAQSSVSSSTIVGTQCQWDRAAVHDDDDDDDDDKDGDGETGKNKDCSNAASTMRWFKKDGEDEETIPGMSTFRSDCQLVLRKIEEDRLARRSGCSVEVIINSLLNTLYKHRLRIDGAVTRLLINFLIIEEGYVSTRVYDNILENALMYVLYEDIDDNFDPLVQVTARLWGGHYNDQMGYKMSSDERLRLKQRNNRDDNSLIAGNSSAMGTINGKLHRTIDSVQFTKNSRVGSLAEAATAATTADENKNGGNVIRRRRCVPPPSSSAAASASPIV